MGGGNIPDLVQILQPPASSTSSVIRQPRSSTTGTVTPKPILFTFVHAAATRANPAIDFGLQLNTHANLLVGNNAVASSTSVKVRVMQLFRAWFGGIESKANFAEGRMAPEGMVKKHVEIRVGGVSSRGMDLRQLAHAGIGVSGIDGSSGSLRFLRNGYEALANSNYRILRLLAPVHQTFSNILQAVILPLQSFGRTIGAIVDGQSEQGAVDSQDEWRPIVSGLDRGMRGGWGARKGIRLGRQGTHLS